ncbi:hypothetical protein CBER1_04003 [Cercospora berteroae]|uniref:DUF4045 domain-containing protein n=1 Tax=Cercospora berteroae TaxID=357750 RepID=A0A2S6CG36_9PEZI|nr:hypothetical protein CBER1_04003 [Cercospora berteroae]
MAVDDAAPSASAAQDNDLDPAAFLKSVRELTEKREREDAERYRQLEEKVQKERQERAARRAERALATRSISPDKPHAVPSPLSRPLSHPTSNAILASSPMTATPTRDSKAMEAPKEASPKLDTDVPEFKGFGSIKRSSASVSSRSSLRSSTSEKPAEFSAQTTSAARSATDPMPSDKATSEPTQRSAAGLARSGTLTWNRRPQSRIGGSRPQSQISDRPSSGIVESHAAQPSIDSSNRPEPSREQIAASLGARDPSWFKQTPDRGVGSAAFRRSQVEDEADSSPVAPVSERRGLPGLFQQHPGETESQASPPSSASFRSDRTSRDASARGSILSAGSRFSATSTVSDRNSKPDLKALIAEDEGQRKVSPSYNAASEASVASTESTGVARSLTMSSSQARIAGLDRPASPTKGMGGFVQSAMMKRSDSQNKRWSAQPNGRLSRSNSIVSNRSGLGGLQGSHSMPKLDPTTAATDVSNDTARPTSSSSNLSKLVTEQDGDGFVKPALPSPSKKHGRSKSVASNYSTNDEVPASPGSPSKRFSPLKSSWLESSLTKPESPKLAPAKNTQPSWMADLATRRAQRGSVDLGTPQSAGGERSRPTSPLKESPFGQGMLKRAGSRDQSKFPASATSTNSLEGSQPGVQSEPSATTTQSLAKAEASTRLGKPISFTAPPQDESEHESRMPESVASSEETALPVPKEEPDAAIQTAPAVSPALSVSSQPSTPKVGLLGKSPQSPSRANNPAPSPAMSPGKPGQSTRPSELRAQLKSRPPPEPKTDQQPEFLAKFGALRKTQQEKFVAPDVLKDNILRGKFGLAQTGGPVKTARRDELKEDLLAKKDEFKKAKEEGRDLPGALHARKLTATSPPAAPVKPEALAKRELLGRSDSGRSAASAADTWKTCQATPEALSRVKSLKSTRARDGTEKKPDEDTSSNQEPLIKEPAKPESLSGRSNTPVLPEPKQTQENSKLASRFNPALAAMLARGPPSQPQSRDASPAHEGTSSSRNAASSQTPTAGAPLQDVRKDRAKGPKRRKAATQPSASSPEEPSMAEPNVAPTETKSSPSPSLGLTGAFNQASAQPSESPQIAKKKVSPPSGSVASVMTASFARTSRPSTIDLDQNKAVSDSFATVQSQRNAPSSTRSSIKTTMDTPSTPSTPLQSVARQTPGSAPLPNAAVSPAPATDVPEFRGFSASRSSRTAASTASAEENKENGDSLPSVKAAASLWGRRSSPVKKDPPAQIPAKDEEAAMRSAELLAGNSSPASSVATSRSGPPSKPTKPSRVVSGQLAEASPNKGVSSADQSARGLLASTFNSVPRYFDALAIDTQSLIQSKTHRTEVESVKTLRRNVLAVFADGSVRSLSSQEEYTLYDESVFICAHTFVDEHGTKGSQIYVWCGDTAFESTQEAAQAHAKRMAREQGSAPIQVVRQGHETSAFLQSLGGILITRQGAAESAPRQFIICCRKHLGHIVFDEVDFSVGSLCSGFVYLISYPLTLQETKLYLWKGSAGSMEEISAARLAAMDLSETGEIIEVDGGKEPASFLEIFGTNTTTASIAKPTELWVHKAAAPAKFATRLFRVQQAPQRTGLISSLWNRRPSWNNRSPARSTPSPGAMEVKVETKEIVPVLQSQLEAEGVYLLDAYGELYILLGPLFASHPEHTRNAVLGQTLLLAADYAILSASVEDRPQIPKCLVLFNGVPKDVKMMFRHWDDGNGLWGTAGLMAGNMANSGTDVTMLALEDVLAELRRKELQVPDALHE